MFSLHDIDTRVSIFNSAANDLSDMAEGLPPDQDIRKYVLRGYATGLKDAARSLQRMVEETIEREARDAMRSV